MENERQDISGEMRTNIQSIKIVFHNLIALRGYTKEEMKLTNETRKILDPAISVTATAVREPVVGFKGSG